MPKINVYLPDELAEAVKETGVPVSAICQRALEQSARRVAAIRAAVLDDLPGERPIARLSHFADRARTALTLGITRARADTAPAVGTEHLLHGVLAEGGNLGLRVLQAMEIEPDHVARDLDRVLAGSASEPAGGTGTRQPNRFSGPAANALELAVTEAIALGHNYIGCEHLLLGLVSESDGTAGQVLRTLGAEPRAARRTVVAVLSGYVHLRAQSESTQSESTGQAGPTDGARQAVAALVRGELRPLIDRITRLEKHVGLATPPPQ